MLTEWKPSYKRGFAMQASLALIGFLLGTWAFCRNPGLAMAGRALWRLLSGWPYTLLVILPTNNTLAGDADRARRTLRPCALIAKWAALHGVRTALGVASTALVPAGVALRLTAGQFRD